MPNYPVPPDAWLLEKCGWTLDKDDGLWLIDRNVNWHFGIVEESAEQPIPTFKELWLALCRESYGTPYSVWLYEDKLIKLKHWVSSGMVEIDFTVSDYPSIEAAVSAALGVVGEWREGAEDGR